MENWSEKDNALHATFIFKDFNEAWAFMALVAAQVEKQDHHPDWSNVYNKVSIKLTTHDAGNQITDKDRHLAKAISEIYANMISPRN